MRRSTEEEPALRPRMAVAGEIPWPLTTFSPPLGYFVARSGSSSRRWSCTRRTTVALSPTAEATRLIEPCRTHARRECAGDARFERQRFTVILPVPPGLLEKVATCDEVTLRVARDSSRSHRVCGSTGRTQCPRTML